jgi:hypothetical protein
MFMGASYSYNLHVSCQEQDDLLEGEQAPQENQRKSCVERCIVLKIDPRSRT